jgi:orotidine-5'-phosphate decarboxylase
LGKLAVETGATGVIAPATRPERVAHIRGIIGDLKILSPGVGAQGGSAADTIKAGADYIIVGRAIYQSENPKEAASGLASEIKSALE